MWSLAARSSTLVVYVSGALAFLPLVTKTSAFFSSSTTAVAPLLYGEQKRWYLRPLSGELFIQGEAATAKVALPPPLKGRKYHLFVSAHDEGAAEIVVNELNGTDILVKTAGAKVSPEVLFTQDVAELALCDRTLLPTEPERP